MMQRRFWIVDLRLQIDERRKAQGARKKVQLSLTIPVGASFACDRRIYELRDFGVRI